MVKVVDEQQAESGGREYFFWCPGCRCYHWFRTDSAVKPNWTWNGDYEKPTVSPSIHVMPGSPTNCHLFIKDGQIQFLMDSYHDLKGQTVDMESVD